MNARIAVVALTAVLGASSHALAQSSDNPLSRAVPRVDGSSACFSRS